jgi:phosphoglycolate phosphatase-like HAD superfamily hydrolase
MIGDTSYDMEMAQKDFHAPSCAVSYGVHSVDTLQTVSTNGYCR